MKKNLKALSLNKEVISKLEASQMKHIYGASEDILNSNHTKTLSPDCVTITIGDECC